MPFTFAHPAIVLPLARASSRYFSLTALVIGSIIPDFEYFLRAEIYSAYSHTVTGLLYFDAPVGLIVYLAFVYIVRMPLLIHLPEYFRERFNSSFYQMRWRVVVGSILIGAASHLIWDSFTHRTGYIAQRMTFLQKSVIIGDYPVPIFKVMQHGSTLMGLLVIIVVIGQLPRHAGNPGNHIAYYWLIAFAVFSICLGILYFSGDFTTIGDYVVASIAGALLGVFMASVYYRIRFLYGRII